MAGFLRGWLRDEPLDTCCRYANACGAIVVSRHGCSPAMPTWEELQVFLASDERPFRLSDDAVLEQLHWATTRAGSRSEENTSEHQSLMSISYDVFCLNKKHPLHTLLTF